MSGVTESSAQFCECACASSWSAVNSEFEDVGIGQHDTAVVKYTSHIKSKMLSPLYNKPALSDLPRCKKGYPRHIGEHAANSFRPSLVDPQTHLFYHFLRSLAGWHITNIGTIHTLDQPPHQRHQQPQQRLRASSRKASISAPAAFVKEASSALARSRNSATGSNSRNPFSTCKERIGEYHDRGIHDQRLWPAKYIPLRSRTPAWIFRRAPNATQLVSGMRAKTSAALENFPDTRVRCIFK